MFEKEAIKHAFENTIGIGCLIKPVEDFTYEELSDEQQEKAYDFKKGAEFGYNKAKEEMQAQDYSLGDFVMKYEDGKFKCKDKSGKVFESVDGKTWKEIVFPKENEIKSEMFSEITLPEGSAEFVDKVIADTEKRLKEIE